MNLTIMLIPANYETKMYCTQSKEVLKEIMKEAVNKYLLLSSRASIIANNDLYIILKIPISFSSWGETLKVSVEEQSFSIVSKCAAFFQIGAWGKNRDNVKVMCTCLQDAITHYDVK